MTYPVWFVNGILLEDVYRRSSDAEFILDSDFEVDHGCCVSGLLWKECVVPVSAFRLTHTSLEEHLSSLCGAEPDYQRERLRNIRTWMASKGNVLEALTESPLLVFLNKGKLEIADGWHRLGVAVFDHQLPEVVAICADLRPQKCLSMAF